MPAETQARTADRGRSFAAASKPLHVALGEAEARLALLQQAPPEALRFEYCGVPFRAYLRRTAFGRGALSLQAVLGRIPFTAENAAARRHALRYLQSLRLGDHDRLSRDADGMIRVESVTVIDLPPARSALLAQVTLILLGLAPVLEPLCGHLIPPRPEDTPG